MAKILSTIKQDNLHKNGRKIGIKWETDNSLLNANLKLPAMWHKDFPISVTIAEVQSEFIAYASPIVQNAESSVNNSMEGQTFEVDV